MIVKKVARSKVAAPKSKAAHVRSLADYIAGPDAGGAGGKVQHRGSLNLLNLDHEEQVQEMIDLADLAKRSPQPVQHWIMSWKEGEQPTSVQADLAARMFWTRWDWPSTRRSTGCTATRRTGTSTWPLIVFTPRPRS